MNTKIPTTTLVIALIYVLSPMASATDTTTPQDAINKVLRLGSDYSLRNREDANSAINRMDPSMWEEFRREIRALADSLPYSTGREPSQRISLGDLSRGMATALPVEKAIEILSQDILNLENDFELRLFVSAFRFSLSLAHNEATLLNISSPERECNEALLSVLDALYEDIIPRFRLDHVLLDTLQYIIGIYGMCGEPGLERLTRIDYLKELVFLAIQNVNTPASKQYLLDQYYYAPREETRRKAAVVIARFLNNYDDSDREDFLADILALAASPDSADRRQAIYIAKFTGAPELLPPLEAIAQSDPHVETRTRNGLQEQYHPLRVNAENAIHEIKRRTDPSFRRKLSLERRITDLERQLQHYQERIAAGIDLPSNQAGVRSVTNQLEQAHAELEALQNQPTTP